MRNKLQLVGVTAMYIASKFEEIFPPELSDFAYITDDTYTKSQVTKYKLKHYDCWTIWHLSHAQIVRMERLILKVLDFNLTAPTVHVFLMRYLKAGEAEQLQPTAYAAGQSFHSFTSVPVSDSIDIVLQRITSLSMVSS